jgi:hypothetical protein
MLSINKLTEKVRMTEGQKEVVRQRQRSPKLQRTIIMVTAVNLLHVRSDSKEEVMPHDPPPQLS